MVAPLVNPAGVADTATSASHARRYHRRTLKAPATLKLVDLEGRPLGNGAAEIANLTPVGAFLVRLDLGGAGLPLQDFRVVLRVTAGEQEGLEAVCRPVRARFGRGAGLAVAFLHVRVAV